MKHNGQVDAASPANIRPTHFILPVRYTDSPRVVTQPLQEMLSSALLWNVGAGRRNPGRWRAAPFVALRRMDRRAFAVGLLTANRSPSGEWMAMRWPSGCVLGKGSLWLPKSLCKKQAILRVCWRSTIRCAVRIRRAYAEVQP